MIISKRIQQSVTLTSKGGRYTILPGIITKTPAGLSSDRPTGAFHTNYENFTTSLLIILQYIKDTPERQFFLIICCIESGIRSINLVIIIFGVI